MKKRLANWNEEDGPPFIPERDLKSTKIGLPKATYRILSEKEEAIILDKIDASYESKEVHFPPIEISCLPITSLLLVDSIEVLELIGDMKGRIGLDEKFDESILIYCSYPFNKTIEIELEPDGKEFYIGRMLWEIAKVYENIYSEKWKEIGGYGHILSDLVIEEIEFFNGKKQANLLLGS